MNALARISACLALILALTACPDPKPPEQSPQVLRGDQTVYGDDADSAPDDMEDVEVVDEPLVDYNSGDVAASDLDIDDRDGAAASRYNWEPVFFEFDQSQLTEDAKRALREYASALREQPSLTVLLEGHCDARGTEDYNLALGERRAQSVKRYLTGLGVPESQLRTISYGELRPMVPGDNENAWARNRRVAFTF